MGTGPLGAASRRDLIHRCGRSEVYIRPGGHELQLRHDGCVDQVPVHHQADLHGVGGEGQQVREGADNRTGSLVPTELEI